MDLPFATLKEALARCDFASATVICSHAHDSDTALLADLLGTDSFFIGAIGSRAVHEQRLVDLEQMGIGGKSLQRVRGPIGLIAGAKGRATLAIGVVAEILSVAKAKHLVT